MPKRRAHSERIRRLELAFWRQEVVDSAKDARRNPSRRLLATWIISSVPAIALAVYRIILLISNPAAGADPSVLLANLERTIPVVFTSTITVNGVMIGLVALCSFNYAREITESWRELSKSTRSLARMHRGEVRDLIHKADNNRLVMSAKLRAGISNYALTYAVTSILLQALLLTLYYGTSVFGGLYLGLTSFMIFDIAILIVVTIGVLPLLVQALGRGTIPKEFIQSE